MWCLFAVGCGPRVAEPPFDVVQVYTHLSQGDNDGYLQMGDWALESLHLRPDGTVLRVTKGCVDSSEVVVGEEIRTWTGDGSTIHISSSDSPEDRDRFDLAPDLCGVHVLTRDDRFESEYVAGDYCRARLHDYGHGGYACDWEPCDETSEACSEGF